MKLHVKGSFNRDWKKISNKPLNIAIFNRIAVMESAGTISQIPYFKKLRKYTNTYKSEIISGKRIYWLLCYVFKNEIYLVRIKPEIYFKKIM